MMKIYKSNEDGRLELCEKIEPGVWIDMVNPSSQDIHTIVETLKLDADFILAALDEEERPRIEIENEGQGLIVVDFPMLPDEDDYIYETMPLGIVFCESAFITVCLKENPVLRMFSENRVKGFYTQYKSRSILQMLYKNAVLFLQYLRQIEKHSSRVESELHKSMKNKELIELLGLEKSLVYFSTSLKSNDLVMEKLLRNSFFKKYPEDKDLLDDTLIENKQAIEMAKIYSDILAGTMDAFASVISNNLNIVMKLLTSITIVMAIPTMISGFFGMNVPIPFLAQNPWAFSLIFGATTVICGVVALVMGKKKMF